MDVAETTTSPTTTATSLETIMNQHVDLYTVGISFKLEVLRDHTHTEKNSHQANIQIIHQMEVVETDTYTAPTEVSILDSQLQNIKKRTKIN